MDDSLKKTKKSEKNIALKLNTYSNGYHIAALKSVHFMDDMPDGVIAYTIDNDTEKVFVAYNAGKNKITIKLADALWEVLADESSAGDKALYTIKDQAIIPGVSCLVAVSKC